MVCFGAQGKEEEKMALQLIFNCFQFAVYIFLGFMDFHIIFVGQSMEINGMSSCRQL